MMDPKNDQIPNYPKCILPLPNYFPVIWEENLCAAINGLVIQRRRAQTDILDFIVPESFGTNLQEMSVNLLGGNFLPSHVCFRPKDNRLWPNEEVFNGEYEYYADSIGIYISINKIHNKVYPSERTFPNLKDFQQQEAAIKPKLENLRAIFQKNNKYTVMYKILISHKPTVSNYWHCQIEIAPDCAPRKVVKKSKATYEKDALKALTNFLVPFAHCSPPDPVPDVKESWYMIK